MWKDCHHVNWVNDYRDLVDKCYWNRLYTLAITCTEGLKRLNGWLQELFDFHCFKYNFQEL